MQNVMQQHRAQAHDTVLATIKSQAVVDALPAASKD
jgi:hypothetical protein